MSTLDRLHRAEQGLLQMQSYVQAMHNEMAEQKATIAHLGKMLLATTEALVTAKVLDETVVMSRVTTLEDDQTKDHINQMLKLNAIVRVDAASDKSVLILKQVRDDEIMSNYFLAPFKNLPQDIAEQVVGKTDGFRFIHGLVESEVLEIYNQAE